MNSNKQYIGIVIAIAMLLTVSCQRDELIDDNGNGTGELRFSPTLSGAETATRAAESDNSVLKVASAAGTTSSHIVIDTYTGTPGSSLKKYFADELGYFGATSNWNLNSGTKRFLPEGGMNLYAYFATNDTDKGDLTGINYTAATDIAHPKLAFEVAQDEASQTDLIAAKVEGITNSNIHIPLRHILSQINFGVKGLEQHQITIKNIRINNIIGSGSFDYGTWLWTPDTKTTNYPYYYPDRKKEDLSSGLGDTYKTLGIVGDSKNSYFFGDGGKFGPGKDATFLYAQVIPGYATKDNTTTPLRNSLMLLPQEIKKNADATVTFDYEITNQGTVVRSGTNSTVRLDTYYDWKPNMRYVYIFKFDDPQEVIFDVLIEAWTESPGNIETDELNSVTLFEKHVRSMKAGSSYDVPLGGLSSDFTCDWSLYSLDNSFTSVEQAFSLSFKSSLSFEGGKSVVIKPPFGFKASPSKLTAPGTFTFTPIYPYYTTSTELNAAIKSSGNYVFSVHDDVKLNEITFTGSTTAEWSLTLHYLSPYSGTPPSRWSMYDQNTAVCFPNDYALTSVSVPYSYTIYTVHGLKAVFDWMNTDGMANPGGSNSSIALADRMKTNINLAQVGRYNLADVYANATNGKTAFVPIGTDENNPYTGTFDGNGATVENLYINNSGKNYQGFFGVINGGKVQNLQLNNVSIVGNSYIGGIVGFLKSGNIIGCSVSGSLYGYQVGGIAGSTWSVLIYACYSTATLAGGELNGISNSIYINDKDNYYVASSEIGTGGTRVPSIAALNGKTRLMNIRLSYLPHDYHYTSGTLNTTTPIIEVGKPSPQGGGILKGTFIQNWFAFDWDQSRWNTEMAILATIGMEYLVIDQVMEYNISNQYISWYQASSSVLVNDKLYINPNPNALEYCMKACRAHGIKLFIGTFFDKRYWDEGAAVKNQTKWNNCITTANNIMDELITKYFHGGANSYNDVLAGWYFPYEVDDLNFQTPAAQTILKTGIKLAMDHRNTLTAGVQKPYLFSPFMNGAYSLVPGTMNAIQYANLWRDIISNTSFKSGDILSPQDCIGVGKLTIGELATWMPALKGATSAITGVDFWINVEIFGPGADISFLTKQQIVENKKYTNNLISFSYPIYYSPNSGEYKQGDHDAYKAYYDAQ